MDKRFSELVQIGISVTNVRVAAEALSALLAIDDWRFVTWKAGEHPESHFTHRRQPSDWSGELAFGKIGLLEIELIQHNAGRSAYSESLDRMGFCIRHLMFAASNPIEAISFAQELGFNVSTATSNASGMPTWAVLETAEVFGFDVEIKAALTVPE